MSKAEQFIREHTKNRSNRIDFVGGNDLVHHPWLFPNEARKAVEIARKEVIEKAIEWIENNFSLYEGISGYYVAKEFKQAMKDE